MSSVEKNSVRPSGEQVTLGFNLNEARLEAAIVTGEADPVMDFRCIPEAPGCKGGPRRFRGRLSDPELVRQLKSTNRGGRAIFYSLQAMNGKGVKAENAEFARVVPLDLDNAPLPDIWTGPKPGIVIETSPGKHQCLFPIERTKNFAGVQDIAGRLAAHYRGDSSVTDIARVFRLAGFNHWKSGTPFRSRIVAMVDPAEVRLASGFGRYSLSEFSRLPPVPKKAEDGDRRKTDARPLLDANDLESLLDRLDVDDFNVDEAGGGDLAWRNLAMAVNAATGNDLDAKAVFMAWCAENPDYAGEDQQAEIETRWNSFTPNKPGGIKAGTLYRICEKHGVPKDVLRDAFKCDAADEFAAFDAAGGDVDGTTVADADAADKPKRHPYEGWSVAELEAEPDPIYQWHGVFLKGSYVLFFGRPKTGKTYFVLALSLAMATGAGEFCGKKLDSGRVLYIHAEGSRSGLKNRLKAWKRAEVQTRVPADKNLCKQELASKRAAVLADIEATLKTNLRFVTVRVPINEPKQVRALLEKNPGQWDLVVADTFFRNMSGNFMDAADIGKFAAGVDTIIRKTGGTVAVVAHEGKTEGRGVYGPIIQQANADASILIRKESKKSPVRILSFPELREGDETQDNIKYRLNTVLLDMSDNGDEQKSCHVEYIGPVDSMDDDNEAGDDNGKSVLEDKVLIALRDTKRKKLTFKLLAAAAGITRQNVRTAVKNLRQHALVTEEGLALTKQGQRVAADLSDGIDYDFG